MNSFNRPAALIGTTLLLFLALWLSALVINVEATESPVQRYRGPGDSTPFGSIQAAYDDPGTADHDQIQCHAGMFGEELVFGKLLTVDLSGGYEPGFLIRSGLSNINGLTVSLGSVTVDNIAITPAVCGNGIVDSGEACDDVNTTDGDGCSASCQLETGYTCSGSPSTCKTTCGDGIIAGLEQCDDGNTAGNDGCSSTCTLETGFNCTGTGMSICTSICGDGLVVGLEQCDDHNTVNGDGCSSTCTLESGYGCTGSPSVCATVCGDGIKAGAEACDDGNTVNGDGCSSTCTVEQYWSCSGSMPSVCTGICGDGVKVGAEQCDDGNLVNSDGCSSTCTAEPGWELEPNDSCVQAEAMPAFTGSPLITSIKGNIRPAADSDYYTFTLAGPGVASVRIETYFGTVGTCASTDANDTKIELLSSTNCNNTPLASNDDGTGIGYCSAIDGTGTAAAKNLSPGTYTVHVLASPRQGTPTPLLGYGVQVKILSVCGNGVLEAGETCDDGNINNGDGCSALCVVESGYSCSGTPSVCTLKCGNGIVEAGETCDDGNVAGNDGCSAACATEPGYTCLGSPSVCTFTCGNGSVTGAEQCDDGNLVNGDGCSSTCQVEMTAETESNNTCGNASGPFAIPPGNTGLTVSGTFAPPGSSGDVDWWAITLSNYADLKIQTFDMSGPGSCNTATDTWIGLYNLSGCGTNTALASNDNGGLASCSLLDPGTTAAMKHLAPGTYYVKTYGYSATPGYSMRFNLTALCGNGIVEGSEQCDGGANCGSDCMFLPVCGDGVKQAAEQCDDGNLINGDGCSSTCTWEMTSETESNNTCATANGPFTIPPGSTGLTVSGTLVPPGSSGDVDWWAITLSNYADLKIQTFDTSGLGSCNASTDTWIGFYNSCAAGTPLASNDTGGIANCSLLDPTTTTAMKHLAPGTYYVKTYGYSATPGYTMRFNLTALCGNGVVEGSEQCDGGANCASDCTLLPVCGDGIVSGTEQCDDGNLVNGDGCSSTCTVEPYYQCSNATPSVCIKQETVCNDGLDNDGDTLTDAADPDCSLPAYFTPCSAGESLSVYRSASAAQVIPDNNLTGITQRVAVTRPGSITRVALLYNITHTFDGDVDVYLTPPGGVALDVSTDNGGSGDNFTNTLLDSTCATAITAGSAPFSGCYKPETAFTTLNGTSPVGVWTLKVADDANGDTGTLNSWALILCTSP